MSENSTSGSNGAFNSAVTSEQPIPAYEQVGFSEESRKLFNNLSQTLIPVTSSAQLEEKLKLAAKQGAAVDFTPGGGRT